MPALYTSVLSALALLLDTVPPNCQTCFIKMLPIVVAPRQETLAPNRSAYAMRRQLRGAKRIIGWECSNAFGL